MMGYLCDNIGLILACLPSGSTDVTASASRYITKPSRIPILSPVLFMHVGDPYIPPFLEFLIYLFYKNYIEILYHFTKFHSYMYIPVCEICKWLT